MMVKFGILGMAKSGIAAAYKIKELGGKPFLSEFLPKEKIVHHQNITRDFDCEFGGHSDKILNCDTIIVSPGIPLNIPVLKKAKEQNINIIGEIEFGFSIKSANSKIIAVTGSNGKSTTVSLIHHTLLKAGYKSILAGNIGTPFTAFPIEKSGIDFIVLELSSFQLETIKKFKADIAILLKILRALTIFVMCSPVSLIRNDSLKSLSFLTALRKSSVILIDIKIWTNMPKQNFVFSKIKMKMT